MQRNSALVPSSIQMKCNHSECSLPMQERLRQAYGQTLKQIEPDTFITLATNKGWSVSKMKKLVGNLFGRLDSWYLGPRWQKAAVEKRTDGIGFIEHKHSNIHAHVIARFGKGNIWGRRMMATHHWNELCCAGSIDVQPIYDVDGVVRYCTKEMKYSFYDSDEQLLFLRDYFPEI